MSVECYQVGERAVPVRGARDGLGHPPLKLLPPAELLRTRNTGPAHSVGFEMCSGSEAGSFLRLIDSCITQLKAQGPSRTCTESKKEAVNKHKISSRSLGEMSDRKISFRFFPSSTFLIVEVF